MTVLASNNLTLMDLAKKMAPGDAKIAVVIEMLAQMNPILLDMPFVEGNLPIGERTTVRTGLPSVFWRLLNAGVQPSKSKTAQVDESCGMLEAWAEVDVALANLSNDVSQFRLDESSSFLEAMAQEFASTLFYGNSSLAPEEFNGLSVRYGDLSAANAQNIIDGGGTGSDNSSIWLIGWGDKTCRGIYPKGTQAGVQHKNLGEQTIENAGGVSGARMRVFQDQFIWNGGLTLKDWRYVARGCNIDISNLVANSSAADLPAIMTKMTHRIHNLEACKPVFYMNRSLFQYLDLQRVDNVKTGGGITWQEVDGKPVPFFRGIPIKKCDALLETEARVV